MEDLKAIKESCEWQENRFQFMSFNREDALRLGTKLHDVAKKYGGGVAIGIVVNGLNVFQLVMDNASRHNVEWLERKFQTVIQFEKSSLRVYAQHGLGEMGLDCERLEPLKYAVCGGGFPLIVRGVGVVGAIAVSGLPHLDDHQVIIDALTEWLSEIKREGIK